MKSVQLSIIIVNYNVRHFLESCLNSVLKACNQLNCEIWVVDNKSVDGSVEMVRHLFPQVNLIVNKVNVGFSKANNQAIKRANGQYILLLNPDTLLQEQTLNVCYEFLESHPQTGAVGVKMIDGTGQFLPESRRGFPSPSTALFKMIGLGKIFPHSGIFNAYYQGNLPIDIAGPTDVLPGAFMFISQSALQKVGYLDESFFMYGEDIDLSYRIKNAGFDIHYLPTTTIIHYKGESTKKGTLNYVRIFYQAMIIFAEKHYRGKGKDGLVSLMKLAIYAKAVTSALFIFAERLFFPIAHFIGTYIGLVFIKNWWANFYFKNGDYFNESFDYFNAPLYSSIWSLAYYLCGLYDQKINQNALVKGWVLGSLLIGFVYGFLPLEFRNSRMLIVFGLFLSLLWGWALSLFNGYIFGHKRLQKLKKHPRVSFIGSGRNENKALRILDSVGWKYEYAGRLDADENLLDKIKVNQITDLIFSADDLTASEIIHTMAQLGEEEVKFRLFPKHGEEIISSNSKNTLADLFTLNLEFNIDKPVQKRLKRLFDLIFALFLIFLSPVTLGFFHNKMQFVKNIWRVIIGQYSWVGYCKAKGQDTYPLPIIKKGVLDPSNQLSLIGVGKPLAERLNINYAKNYSIYSDFSILVKGWKKLDQNLLHNES